jgi:hypothetical protein
MSSPTGAPAQRAERGDIQETRTAAPDERASDSERPPAQQDAMIRAIQQFGLARLLRLGVAGGVPPLWSEIAVLHFRGSFQNKYMWVPVAYLPAEMAAGLLASAVDQPRPQGLFRALSWGTVAIGGLGTFFHLAGARRQMGGFYNWRYNLMTGPPAMAPPQVALFGLLGVLGTGRRDAGDTVRRLRCGLATSELLLALDSGTSHYQNYYANRVQFTPLVLAPALAAANLAAEAPAAPVRRAGRRVERGLAAAAAVAGLIGFGFHIRNVCKRAGGFSWQNVFYGSPLGAPLQLTGQGVLGLLAGLFDPRRAE